MEIKILGTGCPNCKLLEKRTKEVVAEMGIQAIVSKEEDIMKIMEYGVMRTPGIVIDEKLVVNGRMPSAEEIKALLTK